MERFPSPRELAEEARRTLAAAPMSSDELFEFLVARGIIDRSGRVLVAKLFSDGAAAEPDAAPPEPAKDGE
jgi:hypothetical protein